MGKHWLIVFVQETMDAHANYSVVEVTTLTQAQLDNAHRSQMNMHKEPIEGQWVYWQYTSMRKHPNAEPAPRGTREFLTHQVKCDRCFQVASSPR